MIKMYAEIDFGDGDVRIINDTVLNDVSSKITTAASDSGPSFGLSAGTGTLSFKDVDREFVKLSRDGKLTSYIPIKVYIGVGEVYETNDDGSFTLMPRPKKEQIVGTWVSDTWSYDVDDNVVTVTLRDVIQDLQQYKLNNTSTIVRVAPFELVTIHSQQEFGTIKPYIFNENDGEYQRASTYSSSQTYYRKLNISAATIYDALIEYTNDSKFNIKTVQQIYDSGNKYEKECAVLMRDIKPKASYLDSGNVWSMFDDLCNAGLFCMYRDRVGLIKPIDLMQVYKIGGSDGNNYSRQ